MTWQRARPRGNASAQQEARPRHRHWIDDTFPGQLVDAPRGLCLQPPQQHRGASPPPSRRPIDMSVYGSMSTGEIFRHILTAPSRVTSALVITGEEQMDDAFEHCNRTLGRIVRSGRQFYIGITEHHSRRWEEHQGDTPVMWAGMVTLVQAPNSRMTAQLERRLIAQFGHHTTCRNIGRGGERASQGQPHFMYCLVRHQCNRGATHDLTRHHRGRQARVYRLVRTCLSIIAGQTFV